MTGIHVCEASHKHEEHVMRLVSGEPVVRQVAETPHHTHRSFGNVPQQVGDCP